NDQSGGAKATVQGKKKAGEEKAVPDKPAIITLKSFAPRLPGKADVKVQVTSTSKDNQKVTNEDTFEFTVEETYSSALRIGLGIVGGGAVDREYAARQALGSGQREIAANN